MNGPFSILQRGLSNLMTYTEGKMLSGITEGVGGITVQQHAYGELLHAARLSPEQQRILQQLSLSTPATILTKIHDPPPTL